MMAEYGEEMKLVGHFTGLMGVLHRDIHPYYPSPAFSVRILLWET
jgi:hypothetical protein